MHNRYTAGSDHIQGAAAASRRRLVWLLPAAGLLLAAAGPAVDQGVGLFDTSRILERLGSECGSQSNCITVESKQRRVAPGQREAFRVRCPRDHPHIVGWDTEQHEHITTVVLRDDLPSTSNSVFTRTPIPERLLKVVVENNAGAIGFVTLFLGCSAEPSRATSFGQMRGGVPTGTGR